MKLITPPVIGSFLLFLSPAAILAESPAVQSREVHYLIKPQADGSGRIEFAGPGFASFRIERWSSNRQARLSALETGPRADGTPARATLLLAPKPEDGGTYTFRITDQGQSLPPIWLVVGQGGAERGGRAVVKVSSPDSGCRTWCFEARMECTGGGQTTRCCDQKGDLIFNDTNCTITCISCD